MVPTCHVCLSDVTGRRAALTCKCAAAYHPHCYADALEATGKCPTCASPAHTHPYIIKAANKARPGVHKDESSKAWHLLRGFDKAFLEEAAGILDHMTYKCSHPVLVFRGHHFHVADFCSVRAMTERDVMDVCYKEGVPYHTGTALAVEIARFGQDAQVAVGGYIQKPYQAQVLESLYERCTRHFRTLAPCDCFLEEKDPMERSELV